MQLFSQVAGALVAGALLVAIARQLGVGQSRAFGAAALVPVAAAALIAVPALWQGGTTLNAKRHEFAAMSRDEARVQGGISLGLSTQFFDWAHSFMAPDDTFHLEIGAQPDEPKERGVGYRQAAILQWGVFQLAPNLAFEQSPKARDLRPGEGRNADWVVFYEFDPESYPVPLRDLQTYAPNFAIGRPDAG